MEKNEFKNLLIEKYKFPEYEALCFALDIGENEEYQNEFISFIKMIDADITHLWEDSEEGDDAYEDYEKLIIKATSIGSDETYEETKKRFNL